MIVKNLKVFLQNIQKNKLLTILGMVYTGGESLWDRLRDVWTCGTILASAYVLYHLSAV